MHGTKLKKIPGFFVFVSTDENDQLTNEARLYRDIVRYGTTTKFEEYFKARELTRWLLNYNSEFIDKYTGVYSKHTNMSNKIENRLDRVKSYLNSLIEMGLISVRPTISSKGDSTTSEYCLNGLGWIIGLFLQTYESSNLGPIYQKIFNIFELYLSNYPSSLDTFSLIFFKNLREQGLFEEHIDSFKQFFFDSNLSWHDLIKYLICLPLNANESGRKRWIVWKESYEQLKPEIKVLFLYQLKLYFDRMMENNVKSFYRYEESRIVCAVKEGFTYIIIELECKDCELYYYAAVKIIAYLDSIYLNKEIESDDLFPKNCQKCKKLLVYERLII